MVWIELILGYCVGVAVVCGCLIRAARYCLIDEGHIDESHVDDT